VPGSIATHEPVELSPRRLACCVQHVRTTRPTYTRACQTTRRSGGSRCRAVERQHADEWIARAPEGWAADGELKFVVVERANGALVGAMSLHAREPGMREIGYWTAPWARRRGFTVEAARRICRWGFEELALRRIEWQAVVGNTASRAVASASGSSSRGPCEPGSTIAAPRSTAGSPSPPSDLL
jgi:predicted acetyltransferase